MVTIDQEDYQILCESLSNWAPYSSIQKRVDIFIKDGDELRTKVMPQIDLSGPVLIVSAMTLRRLEEYGRLKSGELAVTRYLRSVIDQLDEANDKALKQQLEAIVRKYS